MNISLDYVCGFMNGLYHFHDLDADWRIAPSFFEDKSIEDTSGDLTDTCANGGVRDIEELL